MDRHLFDCRVNNLGHAWNIAVSSEAGVWASVPEGQRKLAGGRAKRTPPEYCGKKECAPEGALENARTGFPPPPPGRMFACVVFRWCSLAALARPPANFHDASGVQACIIRLKLAPMGGTPTLPDACRLVSSRIGRLGTMPFSCKRKRPGFYTGAS